MLLHIKNISALTTTFLFLKLNKEFSIDDNDHSGSDESCHDHILSPPSATGKASSALSAARAAVTHMRSWFCGTAQGEYVSMGVLSDGNEYGVKPGTSCFEFY